MREEEKEQDGRDLPPVLQIITLWLQKMPLCEFEPLARSCCCSQLAAAGLPGSRDRIKWKKEKKKLNHGISSVLTYRGSPFLFLRTEIEGFS